VHWSGIVSALVAAMFMSTYAKANISDEGKEVCKSMFKCLATTAETLIFLMVGINVLLFDIENNFDMPLLMYTVFLILGFRFVNVFGLTSITNYFKGKEHQISRGSQVVMWNAGLRGAIAFALAIEFPDTNKNQKIVINTTMWIIIITIFGHGAATVPLLKFFKLQQPVAVHNSACKGTLDGQPCNNKILDDSKYCRKCGKECPVPEAPPEDPVKEEENDAIAPDGSVTPRQYDREVQKKRVREMFSGLVYIDDKYIRPFLCKPKVVQVALASALTQRPEGGGDITLADIEVNYKDAHENAEHLRDAYNRDLESKELEPVGLESAQLSHSTLPGVDHGLSTASLNRQPDPPLAPPELAETAQVRTGNSED